MLQYDLYPAQPVAYWPVLATAWPAPAVAWPARPRAMPLRIAMLTGAPAPGGLRYGGLGHGTLGFGAGAGAIEPMLEWFRAGHTIGGPTGTTFRGAVAGSFPAYAVVLGSGAPLAPEATGLAGSPIGGAF
ncbi:MAG TPA: hypothetical protein VGK74_23665 [Symbiobacteriaceae bacterium]